MTEKELRSTLFYWYREAIKGNLGPMVAISRAVQTFYLFDLVSDDIYSITCYLMENLMEIELLDADKNIIGEDISEKETLPFPEVDVPEMEELPFA